MRILTTGGTGFIGQFLIPKLRALGHDVYCLEEYFFRTISKFGLGVDHILLADITDTFALSRVIRHVRPEVIIHLAAMTSVAYSYDHPQETTLTNYMGTVNMAEISRRELGDSLKQFIYPSSAEVYGVNKVKIKRETSRLIPNSPYAVAKEASERYLTYMNLAFGFPVTMFRPFNSYGRKDSHFFVVEKIIWQMLRGQPTCYLGDPEPIRDFLHVYDHVDAYIRVLNHPKAIGEIYNLSTGVGITIKGLADMIYDMTDFKGDIRWQSMPRRPLDIMHLIGSSEKLQRLGWKIPLPLADGLERTINYWQWKISDERDWYGNR